MQAAVPIYLTSSYDLICDSALLWMVSGSSMWEGFMHSSIVVIYRDHLDPSNLYSNPPRLGGAPAWVCLRPNNGGCSSVRLLGKNAR